MKMTMFSNRACGVLCVALAIVAPSSALAQPRDEAHAHYERATAAYALGNYPKAAEEFEQTFDLKPDPALLYNAAQAHRLAGNKARALLLYENLLRIYGGKISNADDVRHHIADVKAALAADEPAKSSPSPSLAPPAVVVPAALPTPPPAPVVVAATNAPIVLVAAPRPLVRRPWLWATVVGGALLVGTALTLGVVLGAKNPAPNMGKVDAN